MVYDVLRIMFRPDVQQYKGECTHTCFKTTQHLEVNDLTPQTTQHLDVNDLTPQTTQHLFSHSFDGE